MDDKMQALEPSLEASGRSTFLSVTHPVSGTVPMTGSPMLNNTSMGGNYFGQDASFERSEGGTTPVGKLKPIPKERLRYQKYMVYGDMQQHEVDDGNLSAASLSFEDASRLHSSAIAMETATIQTLRNEKWHLSCEVDELKRALGSENIEKQELSAKLQQLQLEYEAKLRLLRDSTEGEIRKVSLRTKELEIALHHKETQLQELLLKRTELDGKDVELLRKKAEHYERELHERVLELDSVRTLHRKAEKRIGELESGVAEGSAEHAKLRHKLADIEEQLRTRSRELDERRIGSESLRAEADRDKHQVNDIKAHSALLEERVKSLQQQNEQLSLRNKASQDTFEGLQHSAAEVRRTLEEKVQQYGQEVSQLKIEAGESVRLREEIATLKDRIVYLSKTSFPSADLESKYQQQLLALQIERDALLQSKADAEYWKEQHSITARDVARYQATNATNAVTIEALEAQLLLEKTGGADLAQLCKSKDAAIELERRNYSSVQEVLGSTRRELEDVGAKWHAATLEVERLRRLAAEHEGERKSWTQIQETYMEAKVKVEQLLGQVAGKNTEIAGYLKEIEMLKQEGRSWDILQSNYLQCKADLDKLLQEKALVDRKLAESEQRIATVDQEKIELIGSLRTITKEYEAKMEAAGHGHKSSCDALLKENQFLQQQVQQLTERGTLLAAEKIKAEEAARLFLAAGSSRGRSPAAMLREEDDGERHLAQQLAAINIELLEHSRAPPAAAASAAATATRAEAAAPAARTLNLNGHLQQASGPKRPQGAGRVIKEVAVEEVQAIKEERREQDYSRNYAQVREATAGIKWEGGPIDGLGWSSYYLREQRRVEPLSSASDPLIDPLIAPLSSAGDRDSWFDPHEDVSPHGSAAATPVRAQQQQQAAAVAVARPATAPPPQQQQKVSSQGRLDAGRSQLDAGALLAQTPLTRVMQMQQPRLEEMRATTTPTSPPFDRVSPSSVSPSKTRPALTEGTLGYENRLDDGVYAGLSKGDSVGLGIDASGYRISSPQVGSTNYSRQMQMQQERTARSGLTRQGLDVSDTPGRTRERDPWVGGTGNSGHSTALHPNTITAAPIPGTLESSTRLNQAGSSSGAPHGPPPAFIPTPSG